MAKAAAHFDAQTIALLKVALDEAWNHFHQSRKPQCSRPHLPNAS